MDTLSNALHPKRPDNIHVQHFNCLFMDVCMNLAFHKVEMVFTWAFKTTFIFNFFMNTGGGFDASCGQVDH